MKSLLFSFPALLALVLSPTSVLGDVEFVTPVGTSSFKAGSSVTITWKDSGDQPTITPSSAWTLDLCTGSSAQPDCSLSGLAGGLKTGTFASLSTTWTMPTNGVGSGKFFFLRITWTQPTGSVVNWSDRFSITGLPVGSAFSAAQTAANAITPWVIPDRIIPQSQAPATAADSGSFALAYTIQDGQTRYAPMQMQPGTTITAKNAKRQYPTSAFSIFKTVQGPPNAMTTMTEAWTYTLTSVVNGASPAPNPQDDMQKFLNRWKD